MAETDQLRRQINLIGWNTLKVKCFQGTFYTALLVASHRVKIGAGLVTGGAGSTFDTADENLPTGIGLLAVIPMDTEVLCIVKSALMVPVRQAVCLDFFRDGSRIFTQVSGNVFGDTAFIQRGFNVYTVFKGKMFLVTGNICSL